MALTSKFGFSKMKLISLELDWMIPNALHQIHNGLFMKIWNDMLHDCIHKIIDFTVICHIGPLARLHSAL